MKHVRVIIAILLILIVWFGSGCMNAKKASNYMRNHPDVAAPVCADLFPVKSVTDSSAYLQSLAVIDSLINTMADRQDLTDRERSELYSVIDRLQNNRPDCDSVVAPVRELADREKSRADNLQSSNQQLRQAARNLKPIRDTIENTAKTRAYQLQLQECADEKIELSNKLSAMTQDRDKWRSEARGWKRKFWILLIVAAVLIFRKQLFSLLTKIPFMKSILILLLASITLFSCSTKPDNTIHKETTKPAGWALNEAGTANEQVFETYYTIEPTWGQAVSYAFDGGYGLWIFIGILLLAAAAWVFYTQATDRPIFGNWDPRKKKYIWLVPFALSLACFLTSPIVVNLNNAKPVPKSQYDFYMQRDGNIQGIWDSLESGQHIVGGKHKK